MDTFQFLNISGSIQYASYAKSADICQFLVERGADVDALEVLVCEAYGEDWESLVYRTEPTASHRTVS